MPLWNAIEPLVLGNSSELLNKMLWIRLHVPFCFRILKIAQLNTILACNVILSTIYVTVFVLSIPFERMFCFSTNPPFQASFVAPSAARLTLPLACQDVAIDSLTRTRGTSTVGNVCADDS